MEAKKPDYFIDGFMIKHFGVYPIGFDKNNLFEEQKIFLIFLIGSIPSIDDWSMQVDYKFKKEEIENISDIELTKTDIDVAKLQGKSISELKKERLIQEREKKIKELDEKFGIEEKEEEKEYEEIEGLPNLEDQNIFKNRDEKDKLLDMLNGRNILKTAD